MVMWFGYIITDPVTGDVAYKISGGLNGSYLDNINLSSLFQNLALSFKSFILGVFDHILTKPLFTIADFLVNLNSQFKQLSNECSGLDFISATATIGIISSVALVASIAAPFVLGLIFAIILPLIISEILFHTSNLCNVFLKYKKNRYYVLMSKKYEVI